MPHTNSGNRRHQTVCLSALLPTFFFLLPIFFFFFFATYLFLWSIQIFFTEIPLESWKRHIQVYLKPLSLNYGPFLIWDTNRSPHPGFLNLNSLQLKGLLVLWNPEIVILVPSSIISIILYLSKSDILAKTRKRKVVYMSVDIQLNHKKGLYNLIRMTFVLYRRNLLLWQVLKSVCVCKMDSNWNTLGQML